MGYRSIMAVLTAEPDPDPDDEDAIGFRIEEEEFEQAMSRLRRKYARPDAFDWDEYGPAFEAAAEQFIIEGDCYTEGKTPAWYKRVLARSSY
jgi:hypothetical protein